MKTKSRSTRTERPVARMDDEHAHHAHRHLHHLVGVRVVHESAARSSARTRRRRSCRDRCAAASARRRHPCRSEPACRANARGVLGQPVGDEDADLVAFHALDGGAGRLAVIAPQMRVHAGRASRARPARQPDGTPSSRRSSAMAASSRSASRRADSPDRSTEQRRLHCCSSGASALPVSRRPARAR